MTAALFSASMRLLRVIFALLLASAFPLAANECLLAATFPAQIEDCCGGHAAPVETGAGESNCATCTVMETGVNPAAAPTFAAGAVEWREEVLLSEHLRMAQVSVENESPVVVPEGPPEVRPLWSFVVRTALPVRGPSSV